MGKISLRSYNHEIETLIERGHTEEAIAHCKYILKTYPKHLDTYRLLGKAFLESQRYSEAADILQRILSVLPDDFVAQIGMSIIREDEGNLDAAIYHMERAFEIQPSNAAIQDELRRLYGRRDGLEPSKLRLTRGALVRMYARGDLYRQAIAEARAAIVEDPQRLDLEIVLARMYSHTGAKAEAAEICSRLVSKLPYCLEANRILAEVLPETSRAEDARVFQQRLVALDPYLAYLSDSSTDVRQVQDNAVTLDRLEWVPSMDTDQPTWAKSLGIQLADKDKQNVPEWMTQISSTSEPERPEQPAAQPFSEEPALFEQNEEASQAVPDQQPAHSADLPDWMESIGWSISGQPAQEIPQEELPAVFEEGKETPAVPAEVPDWLKDIAPVEPPIAPVNPDDPQNLDWLSSILPAESSAAAQSSFETGGEPSLSGESPALIQEPEPQPSVSDELPDWLKSGPPSTDENFFIDQNQEPLPDWLTDSLKGAVEDQTSGETVTPESPASASEFTLASEKEGLETITPAIAAGEDLGLPASEIHPATQFDTPPSEKFIEQPLDRSASEAPTGEIPGENKLSELNLEIGDTQPVRVFAESTVQNNRVEESDVSQPGQEPSVAETSMDDAMAWLESLAAKQGAEEETLLTRPENRVETPPDWVTQAFETVQPIEIESHPVIVSEPEESPAVPNEEPFSETSQTQVEDLAQASAPETPSAETEPPLDQSQFTPTHLPEEQAQPNAATDQSPILENIVDQEEKTAPSSASQLETPATESADFDAAFAWLESLAAKHGAEADSLLVSPEERQDSAPDWIDQQTKAVPPAGAIEPAEKAKEPLPDWIQNQTRILAQEEPDEPVRTSEQNLPDWIQQPSEANVSKESTGPGDETQEAEPDWIKPESEELTSEGVSESAGVSLTSPSAESHLADWILNTEETPIAGPAAERVEASALPDWLKSLESSPDSDLVQAAVNEETMNETEPSADSADIQETTKADVDWFQEFTQPPVEGTEISLPEETIISPESSALVEPITPPATRELGKTRPLPSWLAGDQPQPPVEKPVTEEESLPSWMKAETGAAAEPIESAAESLEMPAPELPEWLQNLESETQEALPAEQNLPMPVEVAASPILVSDNPDEMIIQAQTALSHDQVDTALTIYSRLIPQGKHLDETIHDLKDALYRFPVESSIWQTLGDACMRNNQIQEALDAYTKAEELLK
jgi:tetratricopeptide (TPR) repeat protein